jgi:thiamine pyrophosphate-dependent acetolactate synthase large subunit-like protein
MTLSDYYQILGLPVNSSVNDIKKAYRQKARIYHPDINPSPEAKDMFILATEAYEFLIANHERISTNDEAYRQAMENWRKYRQDRSKQRANAYARASYVRFKKTKFYKTTRILDGTTIIFSLTISIIMVIYTVFGYIYRLGHPIPEAEQPTIFVFLMLLTVGMGFVVVSLIYLKAYIETSKKHRKRT